MKQNTHKKTALITGAGQGIGRAIAVRLAMEGATVFVNDVIREKAECVVSEITGKGGEAYVKCADVSKSSDVKQMISEIIEIHGHIDILVNSARVEPPRPATLPLEQWWDWVVGVALKGAYLCTGGLSIYPRCKPMPVKRMRTGSLTAAPNPGCTG